MKHKSCWVIFSSEIVLWKGTWGIFKQMCDLYHLSVSRKSLCILRDKTHPLNICFQHLPSGRWLEVLLAKKNVYKKSFKFYTHCCFSFKCRFFKFFNVSSDEVCVCAHACMCGCACMHMWMHVCSEHYTCVCRCMYVKEAGAGERGKECESEIQIFYAFISYL